MFLPLLFAVVLALIALVGLAPRSAVSYDQDSTPTPGSLAPQQEIQRLVNQSLLRATVIDATRRAGYTGMPGNAATATAIYQEFLDNFATIEALRPTADSLHIVLWQHPIQPTLESEATLFAEACQAAGIFCPTEEFEHYPTLTPYQIQTSAPNLPPTPTAYDLLSTPQAPVAYPNPPADQPTPYP